MFANSALLLSAGSHPNKCPQPFPHSFMFMQSSKYSRFTYLSCGFPSGLRCFSEKLLEKGSGMLFTDNQDLYLGQISFQNFPSPIPLAVPQCSSLLSLHGKKAQDGHAAPSVPILQLHIMSLQF